MSSGGGGNTTQTQKFEAPDFTLQGWQDYLNGVTAQAPGVAAAQYQGPTVAPLSQQSQTAGNMASSLAQYGSPLTATAYGQLQHVASGNAQNPYATMTNPYAGQSPYLQSMIDSSNNDITNKFASGTAAQTDASAAMQGAYGGSGYQATQAANAKSLADSLANNEAGYRNTAFNTSATLADNQLNRASQGFQQDTQNALQAAGQSPAMEAADTAAINSMNQYGNQSQAYSQQVMTALQNAFTQQNQAGLTGLDLIRNALSAASGNNGSSSSQTLNSASGLQTALGLGSLGAAGLNSVLGSG